jgi:hypothetical protein
VRPKTLAIALVSPLMFVTLGVLAFALTSWLMDRKLNL